MVQTDAHIAVLVFPFAAHAASLLSIINRLSISAPNALFTFFSTPQSNATIFSNSISKQQLNIKPYNVSDGVPDGYVFSGKHQEDIELFMNAADGNFRKAIEAAVAETGRSLTCLVTDAFLWFAAGMAEDWNVPWVACWTSGPNSLSTHVYTDSIRAKFGLGGIQGRENERLEFIPGMSKVRIADLPEGVLFGNLESVFSVMLYQMGRMLPQAAAVSMNGFEELDPEITSDLKSKFNKLLSVGPFSIVSKSSPSSSSSVSVADDRYGCLPWLDKQKKAASVAYISFGTAAKPSADEIAAIAEALEASKVPFIWSLKQNLQANLPKGFLERTKWDGIVVEWAPQVSILAHRTIGVFVTHCGWNSVLESIAEGVPMIGRPFFGDHGINGRMMEDVWEIGVIVQDGAFTKTALLNSLDLILYQEKGEKIRANATKLKQLYHNATAPGGSSMKNFGALLDIVSRSSKP